MSKGIVHFSLIFICLMLGLMPAIAQTADCEPGFRPFVDVTGVAVCVPDVPERIVAIHDINAGAQVLALGGPLVGLASRADGFRADVTRFFDLEGIVDVGNVYEPNLERILELQPDLIVHEGFDGQVFLIDDDVLASLQAIAPVVAIDPFRPVEDVMADYQELLGEAATISLEEQQETFEALLTDIRNLLDEDWQSITLSFVNASDDGSLQAWGTTALVPLDILTRVGVNWVAIQQEADLEENGGFIGSISLERINEFNADLTLVDVRFSRDILENPLYQQLSAVRAGQVILLDEPLNGTHYPNYIAVAHRLLSDLTALGAIDPDLINEPESEATAACQPGLRLISHAMGETCVPQAPQRVVVLDTGELDNALALGATIVGAPVNDALQYQEYLSEQLDGIADIGTISTPNLEAILALAPDLILGSKQRYETIYEELSAIAPTVLTESLRVPWQQNFTLHADALNKLTEAEGLLARYEARIAEVQAALGDALDTTTISVIRFRPGQVRIYLKSSYIGYILQDVGLPRPESQDEDVFSREISLEEVRVADADYIFITGYAQDDSDLATFLNSPLWQTLDAVQAGRALDVDDDTWVAGLGVQSALLVLDDLERLLSADAP